MSNSSRRTPLGVGPEGAPREPFTIEWWQNKAMRAEHELAELRLAELRRKEEPKVALELFHGRTDPAQNLESWGEPGPVFLVQYAHVTYLSDLKLNDDGDELSFVEDLVYYDGRYYGDWSVFPVELLDHKDNADLKARVQEFDRAKAARPVPEVESRNPTEDDPVVEMHLVSNEPEQEDEYKEPSVGYAQCRYRCKACGSLDAWVTVREERSYDMVNGNVQTTDLDEEQITCIQCQAEGCRKVWDDFENLANPWQRHFDWQPSHLNPDADPWNTEEE